MQVGDMDLVNAIVNLEVKVELQGQVIDKLLREVRVHDLQIESMKKTAQERVKAKYPGLGIQFS